MSVEVVRVNLRALLLCSVLLACSRENAADLSKFHGVKLGMGLRDVREKFDAAADGGTWTTSMSAGLTVLAWSPSESSSSNTRFEFHNGMLVAVRAPLASADPLASGPRVSESKSTVALREEKAGVKELTLIARDCPAHRAEVDSILSRRSK